MELLEVAITVDVLEADPELEVEVGPLVVVGDEPEEAPASCEVEVDRSVLVKLRSDSCQRIWTLYAFTASNVPTEKVEVKVETLVAMTVRESEASVPKAKAQP